MQRITWSARRACLLVALAVMLAVPSAAFGADGEIGNMGDTNSFGEITVVSSRPTATIEYTHDCPPAPVIDCWMEYRFVSKCPEFFCNWDYQRWYRVPANGIAKGDCMGSGNEDNEWFYETRLAFVSNRADTFRWKGEAEWTQSTSGSFSYRTIAEALFNVSTGAGFSAGQTIEQVTAKTDYTPSGSGSSGGRDLRTC